MECKRSVLAFVKVRPKLTYVASKIMAIPGSAVIARGFVMDFFKEGFNLEGILRRGPGNGTTSQIYLLVNKDQGLGQAAGN
jgi:hypothetical protein